MGCYASQPLVGILPKRSFLEAVDENDVGMTAAALFWVLDGSSPGGNTRPVPNR